MIPNESIKPRAMSKKELATSYNICVRTLNKWIAKFPEIVLDENTKILTPEQVKMIYSKIGEP